MLLNTPHNFANSVISIVRHGHCCLRRTHAFGAHSLPVACAAAKDNRERSGKRFDSRSPQQYRYRNTASPLSRLIAAPQFSFCTSASAPQLHGASARRPHRFPPNAGTRNSTAAMRHVSRLPPAFLRQPALVPGIRAPMAFPRCIASHCGRLVRLPTLKLCRRHDPFEVSQYRGRSRPER